MIAGVKPYPAYRDSGLPWLGEVPEHWDVRRGKVLFRCIDVRSSTGDEELLTVSSERGVIPRRSAVVTMFKAESYVGYKLCWPGDLVINSLWAWGRGLGVSQYHGIVSSAYGVYRLRPEFQGSAGFINMLVRSAAFNWELQVRSKGIWISRLQLTDESFLGSPFPVPPAPEQAAIVRFLDHADWRIRRYIASKKKLIVLLNEQKQAIIRHAVTRGIDPNVRLKPTEVEWLGDVPEHWKVVPLKYLSKRIQNGSTPPSSEPTYYEQGTIPWYGPSSCGHDEPVGAPVRHLADAAFATGHARLIHGPALLVVVIGATAGRTALLGHDGSTNQQITSYELRTDCVNPRFALRQIRGAERWLRATASTATIPILDGGRVARLSVAIPSLAEQEQIVRHVEDATEDLNTAIERAEIQIPLLHEYRIRLVADVVTGKLDVREAAALLPDEAEEAELPDDTDVLTQGDESEFDLDAALEEGVA